MDRPLQRHDRMSAQELGDQAIWSFIGYVFTFLVGMPLQVVITRAVGAEGLGTYGLLEAFVAALATVLSFGLARSIGKFAPQLIDRRQYSAIRYVVRRDIIILGCAGLMVVIAVALFRDRIAAYVGPRELGLSAFTLAAMMVPLSLLLFYYQQLLRGFLAVRQIILGTSVIQLSTKAAVCVCAFYFGMRVNGLVLAAVVSSFVAVVYLAWSANLRISAARAESDNTEGCFRSDYAAFARNQYKSSLLDLTTTHVDRYLLAFLANVSAVGVFGVANMLAQMPNVFLQIFVAASSPLFARANSRGDFDYALGVYHLSVDWAVRLSYPFFIFLAVFAHPVLNIYGAEFATKGEATLYVLLFASALNALTGPLGMFLRMWGGERAILRLQLLIQLVHLGGNFILIPTLGLMGAGLASATSMIVATVAGYATAWRILNIRWYDDRYWRWVLPLLGFSLLSVWIRVTNVVELSIFNLIVLFLVLNIFFHLSFLPFGLHRDDKTLVDMIVGRLRRTHA